MNYLPAKSNVPSCLQKLGFDAIPTERELKARWKQIAKTAHPDVGGDEDYFVAMKSSFDEAEMLIKEATP